MAYKFQLGAARLSGSVTFKDGLDANDKNITNIGDIAVDTISADDGSSFAFGSNWTAASRTCADLGSVTTVDINGGSIDSVAIGAATPSTAKFTTVSASSTLQAVGATVLGSTLKVSGAVELESSILIGSTITTMGKLSSSAGLEIVGASTFGGTLGVSGAVTIKGNVLMNENVTLGAGTDDRIKIPGLLSSSIALSHDNAFDLGTSAKQFKDLYVNGVGYIDAIRVADGGTIGCDSDTDLLTLADGVATVAGELSVTTLDIGGANVTSTAAELNFLDGFADASYDPSADSVVFFDATDNKLKSEAANDFVDAINGTGLEANSGLLRLSAQGTGIAGGAGSTLSVAAAQTSITSVLNDSLKIGRADGNDHIDFGTDDSIVFSIDNVEHLRVHSGSMTAAVNSTFEGNVTVEGNLTVTGDSIEVNAGFVVTSSIQFEGTTPDGNEITLTSADPQADRTITLPDLSGHVPLLAGAISTANVTAAEFALLDGGSSVGTTAVATGHGIMMNHGGTMAHTSVATLSTFLAGDGVGTDSGKLVVNVDDSSIETNTDTLRVKALGITNAMLAGSIADSKLSTISTANKVDIAALDIDGATDIGAALAATDLIIVDDGAGGTNRKAAISRIASYVGTNLAVDVGLKDDGGTLAVGVNYFADLAGGGESATLPASPSVGQSVKIKAPSNCSAANPLTINKAGSQTIDGATAIVLESPFAAVELIYIADNDWRVF